jgi:tRNA nucleotidyltransferase (CCA-adding enzyme)
MRLDVATARLEYYAFPAAMPTVEHSSLKLDLSRRDFTINAMAIHLNPKRFGTLVDFFNSQNDLKERRIRVLHTLSFV